MRVSASWMPCWAQRAWSSSCRRCAALSMPGCAVQLEEVLGVFQMPWEQFFVLSDKDWHSTSAGMMHKLRATDAAQWTKILCSCAFVEKLMVLVSGRF